MSWVYLIIAGLLEIGWPLGLKLAQQDGYRWHGSHGDYFYECQWFLFVFGSKNHSHGHSLCGVDRHWGSRGVFGGRGVF